MQAYAKVDSKESSWQQSFKNIIDTDLELTEIKFCKTDVNQRDVITLKPTNPKTMHLLIEKFINSKIIKNPDLSYIERIGVRVPNGTSHHIDFKRTNKLAITPIISRTRTADQQEVNRIKSSLGISDRQMLIDINRDFLSDLFDDIGIKQSLKSLELDKFDNMPIIKKLQDKKLISLNEEYAYSCRSDICHRRSFSTKKVMKRCKYCLREGHLIRYTTVIITPNYKNILKNIVNLLKKNGIHSKIVKRSIYSNSYDFVLVEYQGNDCLLYLNSNGLSKPKQNDFAIDLQPFVIFDFNGEAEPIISKHRHISGGVLLKAILEESSGSITSEIKAASEQYQKGIDDSLALSKDKLDEIKNKNSGSNLPQAKKGPMFEKLVRPMFSKLFISRPLSSKNKPDGVFFINNTDYALWDGKRYDSDKTSLTKYIKRSCKKLPKDIEYIKTATSFDKLQKRNLKFYIFVTKGITKKDFYQSQQVLNKLLRKHRRSHVKISCMDIGAIISLENSLIDEKTWEGIAKNRDEFLKEFVHLLKNGFIESNDIQKVVSKLNTSQTYAKTDESTFTVV